MFTPIKTERLLLRKINIDDISDIFSYRSDPAVFRFQNWTPTTIEDTRQFLEPVLRLESPAQGKWFQIGICLYDTGKFIGDCGISLLADVPRQAEVGVSLNPSYQKHGYASEAIRAIITYLFDDLNMHRVIGSVDPRNINSASMLKRVGMRQEAHFIQSYWSKGEWTDDLVFAILQHEWNK